MATRIWFVAAIIGQFLFAFSVAAFYGSFSLRGNWAGWNKGMSHGYLAGDQPGNVAVVVHIASAVLIVASGALQLLPVIRRRWPRVHRWNGRFYMTVACLVSVSAMYMTWFGRAVGDLPQHLIGTLNAALVLSFAFIALRYARAKDFRAHGRWAQRLFLVTLGVWFFRVELFLFVALFGQVGFDATTASGPMIDVLEFAAYALPLLVFELWYRARSSTQARVRNAMAGALVLLTLVMSAGIAINATVVLLPRLRTAFDSRISIADTLDATITAQGIDAAVAQYRQLHQVAANTYNFDERELNDLGYRLIRQKRLDEAVAILRLNVEAYPQSANVYDSLGEALLDEGDKTDAMINYRQSLRLNPANKGAAGVLKKLGVEPAPARSS